MEAIVRTCLYISMFALLVFPDSLSFSAGALIGKVTSVQGQYVELDIGANQGITVGDVGRVFYNVKIQGKDRLIYIAKFKVTHISPKSCMAQIDVRTGDLKVGLSAEITRTGDLEITSAPPGASVHVNGKSVGVTPYGGKDYSAGPYNIRVEKEGYETWEKQITVEAGRAKQVLAELVVLKIGQLEIKSEPSGAKIYLDGKEAGETPSVLSKVNAGPHRIQVTKDGYAPFERTVEVRARERARIEASLKRVAGGISVATDPPGANVTIDGKRAGVSPYGGKGLTPGKHKVRVDKEGYEAWEGEVTVIAERDVEVPVALKLKRGELLVQSDPPGAKVSLTGKQIGDTPIKVSDILPGTYELRITKEGYAPHEAQVKVVGGRTETVQASLRKSMGGLLIRTEPAGAKVFIDGKLAGVSPFQGEGLTPGKHKVQASKEAHETQEKEVTVKANEQVEVSLTLKRITGALVVQTEPPGANVYVDGKSLGVSPYEAKELFPGTHRVRIVKEGYEVWEKEVMVEGGKRARIETSLRRVMGGILVMTEPPGANVSVDGKSGGVSPFRSEGLTPGKHRVQVSKEAYETQEKEVIVKANEQAEVSINLKRVTGAVVVQTEPPGASVYVDGKSLGVSPYEAKELLPGTHRVRIVKEGYEVWEKEVMVEGGKRVEVRPQLARVVPPKSQELPPSPQTKVTPPKAEKPPALKPDAPMWSINDSWGYVNVEGKVWETKVVKIERDLFIVNNTGEDGLLGIDKRTLQAKVYIRGTGKIGRETELGDFQLKFPLEINKEWNQMITAVSPAGHMPVNFSNRYRVITHEDITVRAGTFRAFKVELKQVFVSGIRADMSSKDAYIWYAPEIKKEVKVLYEGNSWGSKAKSYELTSYKLN